MESDKNTVPKEEVGGPHAAGKPLHILVKEAFKNPAKEKQLDEAESLGKDNVQTSVPSISSSQQTNVLNGSKTSNAPLPSLTSEKQKLTSCQTKADGNCFFHAAFGIKNIHGQYETTRGKEMRREWHNFLSQFHSLKDENMPDDLKDQLKKIFTMFLNDPSYLTGRSDLINNLVNETKKKIRHSDVKVEELKIDIINKFHENEMFRKEIMDVICSPENSEVIELELLRDHKTLKTRISECLEECALKLYPHLSKSQCQEMYNSQTIADLFLEDSNVYKNYIDVILNQEYFIFFEEIPILASLGNIKISIYRYNANTKTVFEPNLNILGNYKPDIATWSKDQEVTIFHAGMYFSRAEDTLAEDPQIFQLGIFQYQDNRKDGTKRTKTRENIPLTLPEKQDQRTENQQEDTLFSPTSTVLKIDKKLQLGRANFRELLTPLMKTSKLMSKCKLEVDAFPNAYELAQLTKTVYTEKLKNERDTTYESRLDLPLGWTLLTTASNSHLNNGYFGAAFLHSTKRHVVIAHRGTTFNQTGAWWTNIISVAFTNLSARMNSAATFADKVITALHDVPATSLSFTGHSLGGWLAHITCFTAMFLRAHESYFAKNTPSQSVHSHTVAFDSPGCRDMLQTLQKDYDLRYDTSMPLETLDVTNYLSAPNRVNTYKLHFGTVYRIFPDFSDMGFLDKQSAKYTETTHDMRKIALAFQQETGEVWKDANGRLKIQEVADWPVSGAMRRGDEYKSFCKWATHFDNYHPDVKNEMFSTDTYTVWRYQTKRFDATTCSLSVFSPNELIFLESWFAMKQTNIELEKLQVFTATYKLGNCKDLLQDFKIDKKSHKVQCTDLVNLINCTKQLLRWLSPTLTKVVKEQLALIPSAAESMLIVESKSFLDSMIRCDVDFEDICLQKFLTSDAQRILSIRSRDVEIEVIRTYKVCERFQRELKSETQIQSKEEYIENCRTIVLNWQQILRVEKFVDVTSILPCKTGVSDVLIITFQGQLEVNENDKAIFENIFSIMHSTIHCRKIIIISSRKSSINKYISSKFMPEAFVQNDLGPISFSDLSPGSQRILLHKPLITFRNTSYSLAELFKLSDEKCEHFFRHFNKIIDSDSIKILLDGDTELIKVEDDYTKSYDEDVFFSSIFKEVSLQDAVSFILNVNTIMQSVKKPVAFFVSGIPDALVNTEELAKRLNVTDAKKVNQIKSSVGISIFMNPDEENKELSFKQFCRESTDKRVYWLEVGNGFARWQQVYDNDFYITRDFNDNFILKKSIIDILLEEFNPDFFIFSNCSRETLIDVFEMSEEKQKLFLKCKNFLPISKEGGYSKFEEMKKYHKPIHLIRLDDSKNKLLWETSSGSLDIIRDYVEADNTSINEGKVCENVGRVTIFGGEPGIGKSTTLYSLSKNIKSSWVIHKDLRSCRPIIEPPSKLDINYVVSFLIHQECDNLAANLLKECLIQKDAIPIVLIFHGFDELNNETFPNKKVGFKKHKTTAESVIQLLEYLRDHTRANIWITSGAFESRILENLFSKFATRFQDLKEKQLKQFLRIFWIARVGVELCKNVETREKILEQYLEDLFADAKCVLGKEISKFMSVPSQMRMIAEVTQPEKELFTDSAYVRSPLSGQINNIFDLYQRFIEAKYDIYLHGKSGLAPGLTDANRNWFIEVLNKKHRILAFQLLFSDDAEDFLGKKQIHFSQEYMSEEEIELNRVGLIQSNTNGSFYFIHRTFAEFFVAEFFIHWLSKPQGRYQKYPGIKDFLVSKILLHQDYKVVRLFLNYHLSVHNLSQETLQFYAHRITKLWAKGKEIFFNENLQTALHVVSAENCGKLLDFILSVLDAKFLIESNLVVDTTALIAARDKLGKTALYVASENKCNESVTKFMQYMKSSSESVQQKIILSTIYRKYDDKYDPHVQYLLGCIARDGGITMNIISQNIQREWEMITPFLSAAELNNVGEVQRLANNDLDQNSRSYFLACSDKNGKTALHLASENGGMETVDYLVKERVLLNTVDYEGMTPLHHAARGGFLNVVQLLHRQGGDIKATDNYNMTTLAYSSEFGHLKVVDYLFNHEVDVNLADRNGVSPAQHAAKSGNLDVLQYLTDHGANIYVFDRFGMCALSWAARSGHVHVVDYLVQQSVNIDCQDRYGMSALQIAIKANKWDVVTYLVTHGADTNSCDWNGMTALQRVIKAGKWSVAKYLITQGASLGEKGWKGNYSMFPLVKACKWDLVIAVIERGASIADLTSEEKRKLLQQVIGKTEYQEIDGHESFYRVIRLGNVELLELLIDELKLNDISNSHDFALILSKSYDELKLKNVPLSSDMQFFVENKLIQLQFFSDRTAHKSDISLEDVKNMISMTCSYVGLLNAYLSSDKRLKTNRIFIHTAKETAKNIHVLKRYLKNSYTKLPWEEMEFCLLSFVSLVVNPESTDEIWKLVLDKHSILNHLLLFSGKLEELKNSLQKKDITGKGKLPARNNIIKNIIDADPRFKDLYDDYNVLRNIYSLNKIDSYIKLSVSIDLDEKRELGKFVIQRTLQILGECLKNTAESPNVTDDVHTRLLETAPRQLKDIVTTLRDSLSHADSLTKKVALENGKDDEFFKNVQNDLKKIGLETTDILQRKKIDALKVYFRKLRNCKAEEVQGLAKRIDSLDLEEMNYVELYSNELDTLKRLVNELKSNTSEISDGHKQLIEKINTFVEKETNTLLQLNKDYLQTMKNAQVCVHDCFNFKTVRIYATMYLENLEIEERNLKKLLPLLYEFSEKTAEVDLSDEILFILYKMYSLVEYEAGRLRGIDEIKGYLIKEDDRQNSDVEERLQDTFDKIENNLVSDHDKKKLRQELSSRINIHRSKKKLIHYFENASEKMEESTFSELSENLKLKPRIKKDLKESYDKGDLITCLSLAKKVDDKYSDLIKVVTDLSFLASEKYIDALKTFFSVDKKFKSVVDSAIDKIGQENLKVLSFLKQRLSVMEQLLKLNEIGKEKEVAMEILLLELTEILEHASLLTHNKLFLFIDSPVLVGKSFRNYLVHGNFLADLSPCSPSVSKETHARILIQIGEQILSTKDSAIGQQTTVDLLDVKERHSQQLKLIVAQEKMFQAASKGDLNEVKKCIENGADSKSKALNGCTGIEFATIADSVDTFKFFICENFTLDIKKILPIAVSNGSINIIKYLCEDYLLNVNSIYFKNKHLLHHLASKGQKNVLEYFISRGANVYALDEDNMSLLHLAARDGHKEIAQMLLEKGKDVNGDSRRVYPIIFAIIEGHSDVVRLLLAYGADSNKRVQYVRNWSPLHFASFFGHESVVRELLNKGAQINALDDDNHTPLYWALVEGHNDVALLLLNNGSAFHFTDESNESFLHLAADNGLNDVVVALLSKGMDVNCKTTRNWTPLHFAAKDGHGPVVETLLSRGADIEEKIAEMDWSVLHLAVESGHDSIVKSLLRHNANVNSRSAGSWTPLHVAAVHGREGLARDLIERGAEVDAKSNQQRTPLHFACQLGHNNVVRLLVDAGADVNALAKDDVSPLHVAAMSRRDDVVLELIDRGAKIDAEMSIGVTPLHVASGLGSDESVKTLLTFGANVNYRDNSLRTPLHVAAERGHKKVADKLLEAGAELNALDVENETALHDAVRHGFKDVVELLLSKPEIEVNAASQSNETPLFLAAVKGYNDIASLLLQKGSDVHGLRETPLYLAALNGHKDVVQQLLKHGAEVDRSNVQYSTPLLAAVENNRRDVITVLLEKGANVNVTREDGTSPLLLAAYLGFEELVCDLIKSGADVNAKGPGNTTPLLLTARASRMRLARDLLSHGADTSAATEDNFTAAEIAAIEGHVDMVALFLENQSDANSRRREAEMLLRLAVEYGQEAVVGQLLSSGVDVNTVGADTNTALHLAALHSRATVVAALLDHGANVHATDQNNWSPLHLAAYHGNQEIAEMLLQYGADPNVKNQRSLTGRNAVKGPYGASPLHFAAYTGHAQVLEVLLQHGAHVNLTDDTNCTPLHLAASNGHNHAVQLLLAYKADVAAKESSGFTALHLSAFNGHADVAVTLLKNGGDADNKSLELRTPVHLAAYCGSTLVLQHLFRMQQPDVNPKDKDYWTPLHFAAFHGHKEAVAFLIKHGAQVNAQERDKATPLLVAVGNGHEDVVVTLLESGADASAQDSIGYSPLHAAVEKALVGTVQKLIDHGANVKVVDKSGRTPLGIAMWKSVGDERYKLIAGIFMRVSE